MKCWKKIQSLNSNKSHGSDKTSNCMIKFSISLCKPYIRFSLTLSHISCCIAKGEFHLNWRRIMQFLPVRKMTSRPWKLMTNIITPIICFTPIIILFAIICFNNLISQNQSFFTISISWINQLLSITQVIYQPFDKGFEVWDMFLDISKAFDKV